MEEQFEYEIEPISEEEQMFLDTKQGIIDIMKEDAEVKTATYVFGDNEFRFDHEEIMEMLRNVQNINMGIVDKVVVKDINGNDIEMDADTYVQRNMFAFTNQKANEIQLTDVVAKVEEMESYLDFVELYDLDNALLTLEIQEIVNKWEPIQPEPEIDIEPTDEDMLVPEGADE